MRKIFVVMIMVLIVFAAGCGKSTQKDSTTEDMFGEGIESEEITAEDEEIPMEDEPEEPTLEPEEKHDENDSGEADMQEEEEDEPEPVTASNDNKLEEIHDCDVDTFFIFQKCDKLDTGSVEVTMMNNGRADLPGAHIYIEGDNGEIMYEQQMKEFAMGTISMFRIDIPSYEEKIGTIAKVEFAPIKNVDGQNKACANMKRTFDPDINCK